LIGAGLFAISMAAYGFNYLTSPSQVRARAELPTPVAATVPVERASIINTLTVAGEFLSWQEVELHAKVSGYVKSIYVDIGDQVRSGQTLAKLEVPELNAQVAGAGAQVRHSEDEITRATHEVERARAEHAALHAAAERLEKASASRPGLIAQQELDDAQAKDRISQAKIDAAESALTAARHQLEVSRAGQSQVSALQDYSRIVAPFSGVITHRYADTGTLLQSGTTNSNSAPVIRLAEVDPLRLRIPVPESNAKYIRVGAPAQIRVQATGETLAGRVARFTGAFDRSTRTMQVEIDVDNHDHHLAPGMYADVTLQTQKLDGALTIPLEAVVRNGERSTALVVGADNRVAVRQIRLGAQDATRAEILQGLQLGDRVIVGNPGGYQEGMHVTPQPSKLIASSLVIGGE